MKTTAEKLQEIIANGGFAAKVATTILNSKGYKCSWKQWEIIRCSHDDLDFLELNIGNDMVRSNARFLDCNQEQINRAIRNHLYN